MSGTRSAILRAEILRGEESEVTCALEMTDTSVFIVTDGLPPIGEVVHLRLSFPRTVRPLLVSGRVTQVRLSTGPGSPAGFVAEFDVGSDDAKNRVAEVARRLQQKRAPSARSRSLAVLLVEDNQLIRDMFAYAVERYFGGRGGRVQLVLAPSVAAALAALEDRGSIDVVVADHFLPDDTGASLIKKLRSDPNHHRVPIVAMSVGGSDVRRAMLQAGADIFLQKPIVLKDLFCTLEFLMDAPGSDRGAA
jgi:CheY-like chemotaxis protein